MWINPKDQAKIGARLEAARKVAGVTQVELARRLRKPQSFVSAYEGGQRRLDLLELVRIAAALGVEPRVLVSDLLDGIVPKALPARPRRSDLYESRVAGQRGLERLSHDQSLYHRPRRRNPGRGKIRCLGAG